MLALAFTIGTWALDYFAAARGGVLAIIATYTPLAALRTFERGEIRVATISILIMVGIAGLGLATTAAPSGRSLKNRVLRSRVRTSVDVSENRRNSFSRADEAALSAIRAPLSVAVNLAAEDPRLNDLEHGVLAKLRRVVPQLIITYPATGRSGLFQSAGDHYGEIWYESDGRRVMSRSSIEEVVLETVYEVTGVTAPTPDNAPPYPGYPLRAHSAMAPWLFFVGWPLLIAATFIGSRRKHVQRAG